MASKRKKNDVGSACKIKRSRDVLSICEKVKILDMIEIERKSYAEIARLYGKNESSIREVMKNKEKIRASYFVSPPTAKVTGVVRDKVLMKVEKELHLWLEEMSTNSLSVDGNVLRQKALSLYKDFQEKDGGQEESKPFAASRGWLYRFRNRFNHKNSNSNGEATSSNVCTEDIQTSMADIEIPVEIEDTQLIKEETEGIIFIKKEKCDDEFKFEDDISTERNESHKRINEAIIDDLQQSVNNIPRAAESTSTRNNSQVDDDLCAFGKYVEHELRLMKNPWDVLKAKKKIIEIIYAIHEEELQE